jgi:hypothetical protein
MHEADEPNAAVDRLDAELLSSRHGGEVDPFAMQAEPAAGGDHLAIMERMSIRQRMVQVKQTAQPYRLCSLRHFGIHLRVFAGAT